MDQGKERKLQRNRESCGSSMAKRRRQSTLAWGRKYRDRNGTTRKEGTWGKRLEEEGQEGETERKLLCSPRNVIVMGSLSSPKKKLVARVGELPNRCHLSPTRRYAVCWNASQRYRRGHWTRSTPVSMTTDRCLPREQRQTEPRIQ